MCVSLNANESSFSKVGGVFTGFASDTLETALLQLSVCVLKAVECNLMIICISATDMKFSQTVFGRSVPFASAGDCYSAAKCPQV